MDDWITDNPIPLGRWIAGFMGWFNSFAAGFLNAASDLLEDGIDAMIDGLLWVHPFVLIALFALVALVVHRDWKLPLAIILSLLLVVNLGYWEETIQTLSLVLIATSLCMAVGIPVGILAAHKPVVYTVLRPILDLMQTIPTFVYLIPTLILFGLGVVPVYADDEGTPARDVMLIERGVLRGFMHSRETAARMGLAPTGNARAYAPDDEPLVRMRNTAILPGSSTMAQMIEGVDDGYLLLKTGNGQADSTTEFMFGVELGYEIRGGKVGRAIRSTTVSGSALKVLQSVDAVGREMEWSCNGYCGKKQPMVVSVGGPALRALAHLGGE